MKIEVESEDRNVVTGPVRIGIGTETQFGALYNAGAEEVRTPASVKRLIREDQDVLFVMFRPEDTVVMVQPNILSIAELKQVSARGSNFHVPECGDFNLNTETAIRLFRQLKPKLKGVVRIENRRGQVKYPQPTSDQMERIVMWWRETALSSAQVIARVSDLLGEEVPRYWIRDQVKKATGSPARDVK